MRRNTMKNEEAMPACLNDRMNGSPGSHVGSIEKKLGKSRSRLENTTTTTEKRSLPVEAKRQMAKTEEGKIQAGSQRETFQQQQPLPLPGGGSKIGCKIKKKLNLEKQIKEANSVASLCLGGLRLLKEANSVASLCLGGLRKLKKIENRLGKR
jgi:hypothetical protein